MASPHPKPDALKAQKGTLRPSRKLEPSMKPAVLESFEMAPDDLPEKGQQEWNRVMQQLQPLKVLTPADLSILKSYCQHVATMDIASSKLRTEGYTTTITNKGGGSYETKSPWVGIYNEASDRAAKLGQQFGFTPSSRTRIVVPTPEKKEDGFSQFD
ncbi:phage terminase small subunit P27 family [Hymenobacter sp. BT175]|uniref:phage terminase small subunit P27 family n=1 Tax=Hymenobacter translucens TaxID=2886507 RepID=UPI001D0DF438|nr:phage terminase small subunit P27 family [Hymenobacter translucens]MCC2547706.1 phage terminase small subunit P27 family [Hymenobacter translucens]